MVDAAPRKHFQLTSCCRAPATHNGGREIGAPETEGFGLRLIRTFVAGELDGEVAIDFRPDGLRLEAVFPPPGG